MQRERYNLRYLDSFLRGEHCKEHYYVVLLNYQWPSWWQIAIQGAHAVVLADGAATRLAEVAAGKTLNVCGYSSEMAETAELRMTANSVQQILTRMAADGTDRMVSVGDYDSMSADTLAFLKAYKIPTNRVSNQDTTDAAKALDLLLSMDRTIRVQDELGEGSLPLVFLLGAFGGRLDHTMCHFGLLHKYWERCALHLHGDENAALLIPPADGSAITDESAYITVHLPDLTSIESVGVIAHNGPSKVWSRGLKWDMDGLLLSYETVQSGCNLPLTHDVHLASDGFVLFSLTNK